MSAEAIDRLAELAVGFGANVQRGQIVAIGTEPGKEELTRALAVHAYKAGAKFVDVASFDLHIKRARILHAEEDTLDYVPPWYGERLLALGDERAARIGLTGPVAPGSAQRPRSGARRPRPAAVPQGGGEGRQRAHDELDRDAVPDARLGAARVPRPRARRRRSSACGGRSSTSAARRGRPGRRVARAGRHARRRRRAAHGAPLRRAALPGPGTDLRVGLLPTSSWMAARFSTVGRDRAHAQPPDGGGVHDARPAARGRRRRVDEAARGRRDDHPRPARALRGRQGGRIDADENAGVLRRYAERDAGASRLGEVALVDGEGRIGPLGTVFYDTLLDENAASHIALGSAYAFTVGEADVADINDSADPHRLHDRRPGGRRRGHQRGRQRGPGARGGAWQI